MTSKTDIECSFCGKHPGEVRRLIAGPSVYICNECVGLCGDILGEDEDKMDGSFDEEEAKLGTALAEETKAARAEGREPTVVDLVANLRRLCDEADPDAGVVVLEIPLVLAIADGIEAAARPLDASDVELRLADDIAGQAARNIVKAVVTRLFEPARAEGEKSLDACKRLGLDERKVGQSLSSPNADIPTWVRFLTLPSPKGGLGG